MLTQMRFSTATLRFFLSCLLFALTLQLSLVATTLAAEDCRPVVQPGWRPYRVQAADSIERLVARANVALEMVMQVNCLTTTAIEADELLLLPALANADPSAQAVEQNQLPAGAAATTETAPAAAPALLTVISTTALIATDAVAAPAALVASSTVGNLSATKASSLTSANLIAIALFVLGGLGIFVFALRPRADDPAVVRSLFSTVGNAIFLLAGVLMGVILFPMIQIPSFAALPTGVSASIAVTLIGLLVAKELFFSGQQWRTMNRLLNLGIAPLLMIFFLTVATRVAESIN